MPLLSVGFALFLGLSFIAFYSFSRRWRPHILLCSSYVFYLWTSLTYSFVILGATCLVYFVAHFVNTCASERRSLAATLVAVVGLLLLMLLFKCSWWLTTALTIMSRNGVGELGLQMATPLGLSYYLFKLLGYLLDVYWEKVHPQQSFLHLALYVSFFPQIVSGPIQRAQDFFTQLNTITSDNTADISSGLRRILFGLFKKLVIADYLMSDFVARMHLDPTRHTSIELLICAYCFAFQLYADFSGLTDIAIGVGQLFGIKGPENFNQPFYAQSLKEYWRRWHMSLTSWLSDYLFMPLRMALRGFGEFGMSLAIFLNFFAVGVWHGPAWTYASFGVIHGVFMIFSKLTMRSRNAFFCKFSEIGFSRRLIGVAITFNLVSFALVIFRANSFTSAREYFSKMALGLFTSDFTASKIHWGPDFVSVRKFLEILAAIIVMEIVHWAKTQPYMVDWFASSPRSLRWGLYYVTIIVILFTPQLNNAFIYAQF